MSRFSLFSLSFFLIASIVITGCSQQDRRKFAETTQNYEKHDRDLGYTKQDFRNAMAPRPVSTKDSLSNAGPPELAPVIAEDKQQILPQPLVSITVNQDVPIRDIFFELAKQAEVDLELDPSITGSIIFTAYNRPFDQVVERISDMAGLRYTFKNNVLRVERDTPYLKTYHVDYLSVQRDFNSSISTNTSASSGAEGGSGGGENGSSNSITTQSSTNFWGELETNIVQIIENTNKQVALTDQSAPITTPNAIPAVTTDQLATVGAPNAAGGAAMGPVLPNTAGAAAAAAPPAQPTNITVNMAPPVPGLLNPSATQNAAAGSGTGSTAAPGGTQSPYYSINRQAGLINVFATGKQHEKIGAYLENMRRAIGTQVLIEAKILEVDLRDEYSLGIDWGAFNLDDDVRAGVSLARQNFTSDPVGGGTSTNPVGAIITLTRGDFRLALDAISRFGTVHALSSPRLSVLNNQTAVLNVTESRIFFDLDINITEGTTTNNPRTEVDSEVKSVPEGVIITVHPTVDPDTNEITMNLRPSITRVVRNISDPGVRIAARRAGLTDLESTVPEMSIREIDSIVKMHSGNTIIMGGLMQNTSESRELAVPVLSDVPLLGNLFKSKRDGDRKTEMVILLRATVVGNPEPDAADKELYRKLGQDRHPIALRD